MKDMICVFFSHGTIRVGAWKDGAFCLIPNRKGQTETPDVFFVSETGETSVGYPPREYDVQSGRYLDGILTHLEEKDALDGFSGRACMAAAIGQIKEDAEGFLGFAPRQMFFLVPVTFSSWQYYFLNQACRDNGIRGRVMLRVYGVLLDVAFRSRRKLRVNTESVVLAAFLEGPSAEVALAEFDDGLEVVEISMISEHRFSHMPVSKQERIRELEEKVLRVITETYPDLLMMDRTHVIRRGIEAALDEGQDGVVSIPFAAIYPNWINRDQITAIRTGFEPLKQEMAAYLSELRKGERWKEPERMVLARDKEFSEDPLLKKVMEQAWSLGKNISIPDRDDTGLSALRGATMYAYNVHDQELPPWMKCLLLPLAWRESGILHRGDFVPILPAGETDPRIHAVVLAPGASSQGQKEIWVPIAERYRGQVSVLGHVVIPCENTEEIFFYLATGVDSYVNDCYIGTGKGQREELEILYHEYQEYPPEAFAAHDFTVVRMAPWIEANSDREE